MINLKVLLDFNLVVTKYHLHCERFTHFFLGFLCKNVILHQ